MKRLLTLAMGLSLSAFLAAAAYAAPPTEGSSKQGVKNMKKAALAKRDRDKKVVEAHKRGNITREQMAQKGK